jgi:hypothetical protein
MQGKEKCPRCGLPLPPDAPAGNCPGCLLNLALTAPGPDLLTGPGDHPLLVFGKEAGPTACAGGGAGRGTEAPAAPRTDPGAAERAEERPGEMGASFQVQQ